MKILGAVLELPAKQHCQTSPFTSKLDQIGQIGSMYCLAGCSKTAPRILIFSIAIGADYSFYVKTIETHARAFLALNILVIGRVYVYSFRKDFNPLCCGTWTYINYSLISCLTWPQEPISPSSLLLAVITVIWNRKLYSEIIWLFQSRTCFVFCMICRWCGNYSIKIPFNIKKCLEQCFAF